MTLFLLKNENNLYHETCYSRYWEGASALLNFQILAEWTARPPFRNVNVRKRTNYRSMILWTGAYPKSHPKTTN